jgi:hypothetical protein
MLVRRIPTILQRVVWTGVIFSTVVMAAEAFAPRATADSSSVVISGTLRASDNTLLANVPVALYVLADDPSSAGILNIAVDRTTTDSAGRFTLVDNGMDMRPYRGAAGSVSLELASLTRQNALVYDFSAQPPSASRGWVLSGIPEFNSTTAGKRSAAKLTFRAGRGLVSAGVHGRRAYAATAAGTTNETTLKAPPGESGADTETSYGDGLAPDVPKTGGQTLAGGGTYCEVSTQWQSTHDFRTNLVPVRYMRTLGRSHSSYLWDTSQKTQLDVAFNLDGDKYAAGLTYSKSQEVGVGMRPHLNNNESVVFKVRWEYERMREWCYVTAVSKYPLDIWKWVPTRITGGNALTPTTSTFDCNPANQDTYSSTTWVTRVGTVKYEGFFSIAGAQLSSAQTNTDKHKFTITPDNDVDRTRYCGSNDYPLLATLAKEVPPQ